MHIKNYCGRFLIERGYCILINTDSIKLTGLDAINFLNHLYHPTQEEIEQHNKILKEIDDSVTIIENENGNFTAEIKDLNLENI